MNKTVRTQIYITVAMGLLIAIEIVFTRFLAIRTPIVTIGLGFIPVSLAAMLYGPVRGGLVAALGDFIGAILFPIGPYFPGFTLTAFLTGMVYGLFLHKKACKLWNIAGAVLLINVVLNLTMDTYWLYLITGKGMLALLPARLLKCALMAPVQVAGVQLISRTIGNRLIVRYQSQSA